MGVFVRRQLATGECSGFEIECTWDAGGEPTRAVIDVDDRDLFLLQQGHDLAAGNGLQTHQHGEHQTSPSGLLLSLSGRCRF